MSIYGVGFWVAAAAVASLGCGSPRKKKGKDEGEREPAKSPTPTSIYGEDDYVLIPKGTFPMGSEGGDEDERPVHKVTLTEDYKLLRFEVPQKDYRRFTQATHQEMPDIPDDLKGDNRPMVNVTWWEARDFCQWAGGVLPTEAQWERAGRGEPVDLRALIKKEGVSIKKFARFVRGRFENFMVEGDDRVFTHPADRKLQSLLAGNQRILGWRIHATGTGGIQGVHYNALATVDVTSETANPLIWGGKKLLHMGGNAGEWVLDWHDPYPRGPVVDPTGPKEGWTQVLRGGAYFFKVPDLLRVSYRFVDIGEDDGTYPTGFRCAGRP